MVAAAFQGRADRLTKAVAFADFGLDLTKPPWFFTIPNTVANPRPRPLCPFSWS